MPGAGRHARQVGTGAERLVPRAGDHDDPRARVGAGRLDGGPQLCEHRPRQGVVHLGRLIVRVVTPSAVSTRSSSGMRRTVPIRTGRGRPARCRARDLPGADDGQPAQVVVPSVAVHLDGVLRQVAVHEAEAGLVALGVQGDLHGGGPGLTGSRADPTRR